MNKILAIDPGTTETALCFYDGLAPFEFGKFSNRFVRTDLMSMTAKPDNVFIEMIASYGMPVGKEVFETVLFIGQLVECCARRDIPCTLVYRREVKLHLTGSPRAKDPNIRAALIDRFGKPGLKKSPGVTYGMKKDIWQAFALAVTAWETKLQ